MTDRCPGSGLKTTGTYPPCPCCNRRYATRQDGTIRVHTSPWMHTNNGDTCRAAALEGQGIILQPDFLVGGDLKQGTLVELMPDYRSVESGIHAVWPSRKHLPIKLRRLIDFLVAEFENPIWTRC